MSDTDEIDEKVWEWLRSDRGEILTAIRMYQFADEPATTTKIREWAEIPPGSINYQLSQLEDPPDAISFGPLIREIDRVESVGGGSDQRVWEFTDEGQALVDDGPLSDVSSRARSVERLGNRVSSLETDLAELRSTVSDLIETIEEHDDQLEKDDRAIRVLKDRSEDLNHRLSELE